MPYLYDMHEGGRAIPDSIRTRTENRICRFAEERLASRYRELVIRFRGQFCYLDLREPGPVISDWRGSGSGTTGDDTDEYRGEALVHLGRLRYFGNPDRWSFALYKEESETYEPTDFASGEAAGAPEDAIELIVPLFGQPERQHPLRRPKLARP